MAWVAPAFFALACLRSPACLTSSLSLRKPTPILIFPIFILGLLTTELTWFFLALQALISVGFIALGALGESLGVVALGLMVINWLGLWRLHLQAHAADDELRNALSEELGAGFKDEIPADRQWVLRDHIVAGEWLRPIAMIRPGVERLEDIAYGDAGERNLLDIYRPTEQRGSGFPVLLQVHGGAWYTGHKQQQAMPLLNHLAARGWICVSINYRLSPDHRFPAHIIDVKKAIHWIRQHVAEYGGNADFIAITGGSAGGHLTALAALSANDPAYQPGFETADTRVDAAVPLYGVYDFVDRDGKDLNRPLRDFLGHKIMPGSPQEYAELWDQASPVARVHVEAPPFFIIHGGSDVMTSWEGAQAFSTTLARVSQNPVAYAKLPGTQHAFDGFHSIRSNYLINHVTDFLEWAHSRTLRSRDSAPDHPTASGTPGRASAWLGTRP
ncbi:MAG: alpha/beta hydrolase [Gammaproteobacteria bacterium]|nr:MAG: alpha/beta hydrolase [Gammaproteobacteria bacterium]